MRSSILLLALTAILLVTFAIQPIEGRLREGECEVCLRRIAEWGKQFGGVKDEATVHNGIRKACKGFTDKADKRFCYYIGGSEDSATSLLRTISQPLRSHMPAEKICDRLKGMDAQICEVKYDKPKEPVDYTKVNFDKMRVKELKQTLNEWGVKCEGCAEKSDYLRMIKEHLPEQIKKQEAAKAKQHGADKKDL